MPDGWAWGRLNILSKTTEHSFVDGPFGSNLKTEHYTTRKEVRLIQLNNIGELEWKDTGEKYTTFEHAQTLERCITHPGDIVIAKMMPAGRAIIVPDINKIYVISSDCVRLKVNELINKDYLMYIINSPIIKNMVNKTVHGIGRSRTSLGKLRELLIPIPPLDEQVLIVKTIKSILTLIKEVEDAYDSLEQLVDLIKSKILELAIQGKLVEQDENDEPASVLLECIRAEKKTQLGKKYIESYIYKGDDNCYYEKMGKDCIEITNEINFDIPEKWAVCHFETIANIYTGNSINESEKAKKYTGLTDGYNYIATKDISFNHDVDYENGIKIPFSEAKFRVAYKGDPLLCIEGGSAGRKLAVLSEDVCFVNKLCAFHSLGISKKFLYYYLQSPRFLELFKKNTSGLIGGVSINTLKALILTIPPIAEQERIVSKIEKVFSMIDQVEKSLS